MKRKKIHLKSLFLMIWIFTGLQFLFSNTGINPDIKKMTEAVSQDNVAEILKKMESYQTRNLLSSSRENFGIAAAGRWLLERFKAAGPRLNVYMDTYDLLPQGRIRRAVRVENVTAVLPGRHTGEKERIFLVNAHYDSYARSRERGSNSEFIDNPAPGVNDDISGVAALLEMARVLSDYHFDATIYLVAVSGEEQGLIGSTLLAEKLKKEKKNLAGVIALDMIGNIEGGNGLIDNKRIRVFSAGPDDSVSRQLARYTKKIGESYFPSAEVQLIFRADRFGRGGDHTPFVLEGWPGIRMMEANENFGRQHTDKDTFEYVSLPYCTRNIRIVTAILASLASAPPAPKVTNERDRSLLGRGESGYDSHLRWTPAFDVEDLKGYKVYQRKTDSRLWEKEVFVGNQTEFLIRDVCIDEHVFGVSSVDKEGNESQVSVYVTSPRTKRTYKTK